MSLRSKVVGALLGVFILYVLAAWLVLALFHTPAFNSLENHNATNQLRRVHEFMATESSDVDLLVIDWAEWDEMMMFVLGDHEEFYDNNLAEGYLGELGMSFGLIVDAQRRPVWAQAFSEDDDVVPFERLFPDGISQDSKLFTPDEVNEQVSGLIDTELGPAIVSSAAIFWSDGTGPPGGHMIAGKLLDASRMAAIANTLLSTVDLISVNSSAVPAVFRQALIELEAGEKIYSLVKQNDYIYALKMLRDINNQPLAFLRVRSEADISSLGAHTLRITISMLVVAALILTLTLWFVLKAMLLQPIERLTAILRGEGKEKTIDGVDGNLLTTVQRLTDSKGSISQRNDEIGELVSAFDDLSQSLLDATNSVWRIAHQDGLTGLANRRVVMERFDRVIASIDNKDVIAVLFIDLDNFKNVNDQMGHEAGDQLLIEVALRIRSAVFWGDATADDTDDNEYTTVARIGGDEFVVLITPEKHRQAPDELAARIVRTVSAPYVIQDTECFIGACVGLAVFPQDADTIDGILAKADTAMYEAKQHGKNTWRRYGLGETPMRPD